MTSARDDKEDPPFRSARPERRFWRRRRVRLSCNVLFTDRYFRETRTCQCLLNNISEGGAFILPDGATLPEELYLSFGESELVIPSMVIERSEHGVHAVFTKPVPTILIEHLSAIPEPEMAIAPLFGPDAPLAALLPVVKAYNSAGSNARRYVA